MADEMARARKKFVTVMRYRRRLENRLADIDWELDELAPLVVELEESGVNGLIVDTTLVEIEDGTQTDIS